MIIFAEKSVKRKIAENIVHPTHIPLEVEAESARKYRLCNHWPRGALLGYHHGIREVAENIFVELLQKFDSLKIFIAAVFIRHPLAVLAVVIEIQHRCNGVYPYAVKVIFFKPERSGGHQKRANLIFSEVKDSCSPSVMLALSRVAVFIERSAVKFVKTVCVLREVCRNPVQNHAYSVFVAFIYKIHKVLRLAVT